MGDVSDRAVGYRSWELLAVRAGLFDGPGEQSSDKRACSLDVSLGQPKDFKGARASPARPSCVHGSRLNSSRLMTGTLNVPLQDGETNDATLESAVGLPVPDVSGAGDMGRNCS